MSGFAIQQRSVTVVSRLAEPKFSDICRCDLGYCDYSELATFELSSSDERKNDTSTFRILKAFPTEAVAIYLIKEGVILTEITDNTLGQLFTNSLERRFIINWKAVATTYGIGTYWLTLNGVKTRQFQIMPYSDRLVNNTLKLVFENNSNTTIKGVVTLPLSSVRVSGEVLKITPEITEDKYLSSNYTLIQNREQITNNVNLKVYRVPRSLFNVFTQEYLLANRIKVDEFKVAVDNPISGYYVVSNIGDPILYPNGLVTFDVTLRELVEGTIKRNV